jgi:hypothetical protein
VRGSFFWGDEFFYSLSLTMERGGHKSVPARSEAELDLILEQLVARRPHALFGYSGSNLDLVRAGRPALRAEVERRREQWEAATEDDREDWCEELLSEATQRVQRVEAK